MDLDHVAIGLSDVSGALTFAVGELGATILFGGSWIGFRSMTLRLGTAAEGMNVELLEPWNAEQSDFLARFISRSGDGPHHLTFKVDDIEHELARVRAAGVVPVAVNLTNPSWREAFIHPRDGHGTVIQIAQTDTPWPPVPEMVRRVERDGPMGSPWWPFPPKRGATPAALRRVVLRTPVLAETLGFFQNLLDGEIEERTQTSARLVWSGGGRLLFEERPGATPGIDRLELAHDGPSKERFVAGTRFVLSPGG